MKSTMTTPRYPLAALLLSLLALIGLQAARANNQGGLAWEKDEVYLQAELGATELVAEFTFRNDSDQTITITKTDSTCGCTVPQLAKKAYQPGESGTLKAVFDATNRYGEQTKPVYVYTDEDRKAPYKLTLRTDIPQAVRLEPRVRFWRIGAEPETQTFRLVLHHKMPMTIDGLVDRSSREPPSGAFDVRVQEIDPQREYLIHLTPTSTDSKRTTTFLATSSQDTAKQLQNYPIYAIIR